MKFVTTFIVVTPKGSNSTITYDVIEQERDTNASNPFRLIPDPVVRRFEMRTRIRQSKSIKREHSRLNGTLWQDIADLEEELRELRALLEGKQEDQERSEEVLLKQLQEIKAADQKEKCLNGIFRQRIAHLSNEIDGLRARLHL